MSAVRLSLGLFGLVYDITLRVEPDFNLEVTDRQEPLSLMRDPKRLRDLVTSHYFCDVFWFPLSNALWVKTARRTDRPAVPYGKLNLVRDALEARFGAQMFKAMVRKPGITRLVNQTSLTVALPRPRTIVRDAVTAIHYRSKLEAYFCQLTSFAVKLDPGFENATRSWCMAMDRALELAKEKHYPLTLMLQARFIGHSRSLLSPAFGEPGEHHCYLEMLSARGTKGCEPFFDEIATQWMAAEELEALPHWGKYFHTIPGIVPYVHRRMGERIRRFNAARESFDPDGMFLSPYLEAVFYPERGAEAAVAHATAG
jgi:hypothetical protein